MANIVENRYGLHLPFPESDVQLFMEAATLGEFNKGEILLKQGKISPYINFVNNGILRLYYIKNGREYTTKYFFKGSWAGDLQSSTATYPSLYNVEAVCNSQLIVIHKDKLEQLYKKHPIFERYGRLIAESMLSEIIMDKATRIIHTPEELYQQLIDSHREILDHVPLKQIANYLNIEPSSLSRIRRRLSKRRIQSHGI